MILLSYNDFGEAKHPLAQHVARLNDVDDLALLLLSGREAGHGLAILRVEILVLDLDLRDALLAQRLGELLRNEQHARTQRLHVVALLHRRQPHPGDSGEQAPCRAGSRPGIHTGEAPHPVRGVLPQALGGHGSSRRVRGDNRRL